jgi:hypothetical protein
MPNFNPKNPTKFLGTNKYITFFVSRDRQPTGADYRQPETGTLYSVGTVWQVGKNPTTGVEGELWMLSKIVANVAYWVVLSQGTQLFDSILVDASTAPGTNPVIPNALGEITVTGGQIATGTIGANVIRTVSLAANTYTVQIQQSAAAAAVNTALNGVAHFDSRSFTVGSGFVSLSGARFSANLNPGVTNVTGDGTLYTIIYNSTLFDTASGFNTATGVYTIPAGLGGTWMFTVRVSYKTAEATHTSGNITLTSSGSLNQVDECNPYACRNTTDNIFTKAFTVIEQVTAGTAMSVIVQVSGGPKTCGINGSSTLYTTFEGYRLGS